MLHTLESRTMDMDGYTVEVCIYHDYDSSPDEYDCYDEEQIAAFRNNEWTFVGVRAHVVSENEPDQYGGRYVKCCGPESGGLWAVDFYFDDSSREYCYGEIGQEEAREAVRLLRALAKCAA